MKVICPECSAEFDVPQQALGQRGKRVRCASCRHIWLQEPAEERPFGGFQHLEETLDIEPIPFSVHPHPEDDEDDDHEKPAGAGFLGLNIPYLVLMLCGFGLGVLLVLGLAFGLYKAGIGQQYLAPVFGGPYAGASAQAEAAGVFKIEGLEVSGAGVSGRLLNTSGHEQPVPALDIIPVDSSGMEGEGLRTKPEGTSIKPGEVLGFEATLQGGAPAGGKIRVDVVR